MENYKKQKQYTSQRQKFYFVVCFEFFLRFICVPIALYIFYVAF